MVKRLVTVIGIAYLWFALGFSTYAQGNEISQISVKMPEVKVYLNQSIEGSEEIRAFLNEKEKPRLITYHETKDGNIIIDYIR